MSLGASRAAIDFYVDFSSPYSYIASEWIEALAARHGRPVRWHAILLGVTFQAAELKSPVSHAIERGVFGAPFFVVDGEPFWGNDRRAHIERWLESGPF